MPGPAPSYSADDVMRWETAYRAGASTRQIAAQAGTSQTTVKRALNRYGVTLRRPGGPINPKRDAILDRIAAGKTHGQVALRFGVSKKTVTAIVVRARASGDQRAQRVAP